MTLGIEPNITVNGVTLTTAQAMTVRVALGAYMMELAPADSLGSDSTGRSIREGYLRSGNEVMRLMR
ncbi:hypothetical protein IB276_33185 [Ensifer sp. ENS04]|uniref:hypothetical protein n=1 Tax=Ensifer sp. ENS04 TaxID=2769281 RepID=UPI00178499D0|nr:hypothetical protein [Ensifer sp. ENS04]MBD9544302.1 hypothetical protein [Ensifer sp. ENS04]